MRLALAALAVLIAPALAHSAGNLCEPQYQLTGKDYASEAPAIQQMFYNISGACAATNYSLAHLPASSSSGGGASSTVTVNAPLTGDGSVGNPVSLTQTIPSYLIGLSTVTSALAGKLSNTAQVPTYLLDYSTITTAISQRLSPTGNGSGLTVLQSSAIVGAIAPSQVSLGTVTTAINNLANVYLPIAGNGAGLTVLQSSAIVGAIANYQIDLSTVATAINAINVSLNSSSGSIAGLQFQFDSLIQSSSTFLGPPQSTTFTATGQWYWQTGVSYITCWGVGGGGSGGTVGNGAYAGAGGGSGQVAGPTIIYVTTNVFVTVSTGSTPSAGGNGTAANPTCIDYSLGGCGLLNAPGGFGGAGSASNNGVGGAGMGGGGAGGAGNGSGENGSTGGAPGHAGGSGSAAGGATTESVLPGLPFGWSYASGGAAGGAISTSGGGGGGGGGVSWGSTTGNGGAGGNSGVNGVSGPANSGAGGGGAGGFTGTYTGGNGGSGVAVCQWQSTTLTAPLTTTTTINGLQANVNSLVTSTGVLQVAINSINIAASSNNVNNIAQFAAVGTSTMSIASATTTINSNFSTQFTAVGVSTANIAASTTTLQAEIVLVGTSTHALNVNISTLTAAFNGFTATTATAVNLTPTPTLCAAGQYATGITSAGNATGCTAASVGGGGGAGLTPFVITTSSITPTPNIAIFDEGASTVTVTISTFGAAWAAGSLLDLINASTNSMVIVSSPEYVFDNTGFSTQTTSVNNMLVILPNNSIELKFTVANATAQFAWSNNPNFSGFCNSKAYTFNTVGSSTFTDTQGCGGDLVQIWGSGGSGASTAGNEQGGGGGGGAYIEAACPASFGAVHNINIGGAAQVATGNSGNTGGNTNFYYTASSSVSVPGGAGGVYGAPGAGGAGGAIGSVNGCILIYASGPGGNGAAGSNTASGGGGGGGGGGTNASTITGGTGANGGGGGGNGSNQCGTPTNGTLPGGGGGGGGCNAAFTSLGGTSAGQIIVTPISSINFYNMVNNYQTGGWTTTGVQSYTGNNVMTQSTMTVQGNACSVGGSTFVVSNSSVSIGAPVQSASTTTFQVVGTESVTGAVSFSSAVFVGVSISSASAGGAGAAVTALCNLKGLNFAVGGGCSCTGAVGITSVINEPNVTTPGGIATGWTCQDAGGTGAACAAFVICSRLQ